MEILIMNYYSKISLRLAAIAALSMMTATGYAQKQTMTSKRRGSACAISR